MSNEIQFDFNNLYLFVFAIVVIGVLFYYLYELKKIKKDIQNIYSLIEQKNDSLQMNSISPILVNQEKPNEKTQEMVTQVETHTTKENISSDINETEKREEIDNDDSLTSEINDLMQTTDEEDNSEEGEEGEEGQEEIGEGDTESSDKGDIGDIEDIGDIGDIEDENIEDIGDTIEDTMEYTNDFNLESLTQSIDNFNIDGLANLDPNETIQVDFPTLLNEGEVEGEVEEDKTNDDIYSEMSVKKLQDTIKELNQTQKMKISISGNKTKLIQRIKENQ